MLRHSWVLLFAACSYTPPPAPGGNDGDDEPGVDAPAAPIERTCGTTGTSLCLEFEQGIQLADHMDIALDGSGADRDAAATGVFAARRDVDPAVADDDAAAVGITSSLVITKDLGIGKSFTIAMWIQAAPGVTRRWLFDGNRRFFMNIGGDQTVRCGIDFGGSDEDKLRIDSGTKIQDASWHHVACTYDDASTTLAVYVDGSSDNDCKTVRSIVTTGIGATIGAPHLEARSEDHFVGSIDSVRVFDHALASSAVCDLADGSNCQTSCNTGGNGIDIDLGL